MMPFRGPPLEQLAPSLLRSLRRRRPAPILWWSNIIGNIPAQTHCRSTGAEGLLPPKLLVRSTYRKILARCKIIILAGVYEVPHHYRDPKLAIQTAIF